MNRRTTQFALSMLAGLALSSAVAGCGEEELTEVVEGEPIELAGLDYNIQITRFLNPDDAEDAQYLVGQPPPPAGSEYLGVFLVVTNHEEEPRPTATNYVVRDTLVEEYELVDSESPYALDVGSEVPAEGQLPLPDTAAESGPNQAALLIFEVSDEVSENRPLNLEIQTFDGNGEVILDI